MPPSRSLSAVWFVLLVAGSIAPSGRAQTEFVREAQLDAIRISYADMMSLLETAQTISNDVNRDFHVEHQTCEVELTLVDGDRRVVLSGLTGSDRPKLPLHQVTEFAYSYQYFGAPLASLRLTLSDSFRRLTVSGESQAAVDSVFAVVNTGLVAESNPLGGSSGRIAVNSIAAVIVMVWLALLFMERQEGKWGIGLTQLIWTILGSMLVLHFLPTEALFPGFRLVDGDPTLAAQVSQPLDLAVTLVSVLGVLLSSTLRIRRLRRKEDATGVKPAAPDASEAKAQRGGRKKTG